MSGDDLARVISFVETDMIGKGTNDFCHVRRCYLEKLIAASRALLPSAGQDESTAARLAEADTVRRLPEQRVLDALWKSLHGGVYFGHWRVEFNSVADATEYDQAMKDLAAFYEAQSARASRAGKGETR